MIDAEQSFVNFNKTIQQLIDNKPAFNSWCQWLAVKDKAKKVGLENLVKGLQASYVVPQDARACAFKAFCAWLAPILLDGSAVLQTFSKSDHEALITDFRRLDEMVAQTTKDYICAVTAAQIPNTECEKNRLNTRVYPRNLLKRADIYLSVSSSLR